MELLAKTAEMLSTSKGEGNTAKAPENVKWSCSFSGIDLTAKFGIAADRKKLITFLKGHFFSLYLNSIEIFYVFYK